MSIAARILSLPLTPPPLSSSAALLHRHQAPPLPAVSIRIKTSLTSISPSHSRSPLPPPPAAAAAAAAMETKEIASSPPPLMQLLFVEMGVGYDQHGQDITAAAMRACRDAIRSNSIPAFRRGSIPGVNSDQMKLKIQLGVPRSTQHLLDIERVKSVFPYGEILSFEVVDGGMICSSGTCLEEMGDKNEDCYIVNAAVYVGY